MHILIALFLSSLLLPSTVMAETFMLTCHVVSVLSPGQGGDSHDWNYSINTDNNTVNNIAARISSDIIEWKPDSPGKYSYLMHVNRITGAIEAYASGPQLDGLNLVYTGHCQKATERKF